MAEFEKSIAHEAHGLVHGERAKTYGHPRFDFSAIAKVWTGLLQDLLKEDAQLDAYRISVLMSGLKLCRLVKSPKHRDSRVDTIGYMLTMERLDEPEEVDWDKVKKVAYPAPLGKYNVVDIQLMEGFAQEELRKADEACAADDDIDDDDYDVHGRPVDYDDHGRPVPTAQDLFPIEFSQVNIWFEGGETKLINGDEITNPDNAGKTICFPFTPGTTIEIKPVSKPSAGYDQTLPWQPPGQCHENAGLRWVKDPAGRWWIRAADDEYRRLVSTEPPPGYVEPKCPAHGNVKCPGCSQNPDPSRCQCGYFESTGMHWDTCPGRIRHFPPTTAEEVAKLHPGKIHKPHGGPEDCWCGFKAVPLNPDGTFGNPKPVHPELGVEGLMGPDWKKPKNVHDHQIPEPCMPGCPVFDAAKEKNANIITEMFQPPPFEFTGEQVEMKKPSTPWERND